jgi:ABC-2 type transport system permease protein
MSAVRDTWIVFSRAMSISLRNPIWVIFGVLQPVLYLAFFGPLLTNLPLTQGADGASGNDAWRVFVPGLLVQLGMFGSAFVGFGLIAEWRAGVIERMRVSPASRTSLLLGRVLRDVIVLMVQATVLVLTAVAFGLRVPVVAAVAGILLTGVLAAAFASMSYAAALRLRSEDAFAPLLNGIALPLLLLSGILLPMSLAPAWLEWLSKINPLTHVVDGLRSVFAGTPGDWTAVWGYAACVVLLVVGVAFGASTFRSRSA